MIFFWPAVRALAMVGEDRRAEANKNRSQRVGKGTRFSSFALWGRIHFVAPPDR